MDNCRAIAVPADLSVSMINKKDDQEYEKVKKIPYREAVGNLMFAAIVSRPDIM